MKIKKIFFSFLAFIVPAVAVGAPIECILPNECTGQSVVGLFSKLVTYLYTAFFIVAVGFILIAAFNYLQGGTNPEKVKTAKNQLKYAIIAIVIALLSTGISLIINNVLSVSK